MKVIVVTRQTPENINDLITIEQNDFIIAVDGALMSLFKQKIKVDLAIGDFDSLENKNLLKGLEIIKLNKEKDETDTFKALEYAYNKFDKEVFLIGGIKGDRIEHFIANYLLFNSFPKLTIIDENSKIYLLEKGSHLISKKTYISFFGYSEGLISLSGFKYNLEKYILKQCDPLCISNEIIKTYGEIKVHNGRVIVIETKK